MESAVSFAPSRLAGFYVGLLTIDESPSQPGFETLELPVHPTRMSLFFALLVKPNIYSFTARVEMTSSPLILAAGCLTLALLYIRYIPLHWITSDGSSM